MIGTSAAIGPALAASAHSHARATPSASGPSRAIPPSPASDTLAVVVPRAPTSIRSGRSRRSGSSATSTGTLPVSADASESSPSLRFRATAAARCMRVGGGEGPKHRPGAGGEGLQPWRRRRRPRATAARTPAAKPAPISEPEGSSTQPASAPAGETVGHMRSADAWALELGRDGSAARVGAGAGPGVVGPCCAPPVEAGATAAGFGVAA
ncbi:MAG: hypothetical protein ACYDH5_18165 [Acidimicrobiales bacterium]